MKQKRVGVLGATGLIGRHLIKALLSRPDVVLDGIVGSPLSVNRLYRDVWLEKEERLQTHYAPNWVALPVPDGLPLVWVGSIDALLRNPPDVVISMVPDRAGPIEDIILERGVQVISNSPYRRLSMDVPLLIPPIGDMPNLSQYIKIPNCTTIGIGMALHPIRSIIQSCPVVITTCQSVSGRGDSVYSNQQLRHLIPLTHAEESTEDYITNELSRLFPELLISVRANRIPVVLGHWVDITIVDVRDPLLLRQKWMEASTSLPIQFIEKLTPDHLDETNVLIGNLTIENRVVRCSVLVHNIMRGAVLPLLSILDSVSGIWGPNVPISLD